MSCQRCACLDMRPRFSGLSFQSARSGAMTASRCACVSCYPAGIGVAVSSGSAGGGEIAISAQGIGAPRTTERIGRERMAYSIARTYETGSSLCSERVCTYMELSLVALAFQYQH